jgi:protein-disulfide isomerase
MRMSHRYRLLVAAIVLVSTIGVLGRSGARVIPAARPTGPAVVLPKHSVTVYRLPVGAAPAIGPADALVTIVIFGDFECQFTRRAVPLLRRLQAAQPKDIRLVFKHFPLRFHSGARNAALAAAEAHAQGRFWGFLDAVFKGATSVSTADLSAAEKSAGLRAGSVTAALASTLRGASVDADVALGGTVGVAGTPSVYLNGTYAGGALTEAQFRTFIQR